jgi:uncharacterized protein YktA (UPF0223 family)
MDRLEETNRFLFLQSVTINYIKARPNQNDQQNWQGLKKILSDKYSDLEIMENYSRQKGYDAFEQIKFKPFGAR